MCPRPLGCGHTRIYPGPVNLLSIPSALAGIVALALGAVKLFALITSLMFSSEAYRAADKWTKPGWVTVLAVAFLVQIFAVGIMFLNLGLTIAALVFLADVRPALRSLRRR